MKKHRNCSFQAVSGNREAFLVRHPQFAAGMRIGGNVYHMLYALLPQVTDADLLEIQNVLAPLTPFEACAPLHAGILFGWMNAHYEIHGRVRLLANVDFTSGFLYGSESLQHLRGLDSDLELTGFLSDFLNGKTPLSQEMETEEARLGYVCATIAGLLQSRWVVERLDFLAEPVVLTFSDGEAGAR